MLTMLFWNIDKNTLTRPIVLICRAQHIDIIILTECIIDPYQLLAELNAVSSDYELVKPPVPGASRFVIFVRFSSSLFHPYADYDRMSIHRVCLPNEPEFLLVLAHLPSKVNTSEISQALDCVKYAGRIQEAERQVGHRRTLVIGDLNMNPFESGLVAASGFHATMSRRIATQVSRTVQGDSYYFFYNPMWNFMGDHPHMRPPGTHYYRHSETVSYLWNTYDQVLVRPDLLPYFDNDDLRVVTSAGAESLLSKEYLPTYSDHLPIFCALRF